MSFQKTTNSKLTSKDVCVIIEKCARWGVSKLQFGELSLSFAKMEESNSSSVSQSPLNQADNNIDTKSFMQRTEAIQKDEELETKLLENPSEFEEMLLGTDLEDKGDMDGERA